MAKSLVHAYSEKNWNELWSLVDPRIVYDETATNRKTHGIKGFMTILQEWGTAFPDSKITIKSTKSYGNTVAFDLQWTGTHDGIDRHAGRGDPSDREEDRSSCEHGDRDRRKRGRMCSVRRRPRGSSSARSARPRWDTVIHYFDMAVMEKQIELTPEEKVA